MSVGTSVGGQPLLAWLGSPTHLAQVGLFALVAVVLLRMARERWAARGVRQRSSAVLVALPGGMLPGGREWVFTAERVILGRGADASLPIPDPSLPGHALELRAEEGHNLVEPPAHAGFASLNFRPIRARVRLRDGDLLTVGETSFRFRQAPPGVRGALEPWLALLLASALFVGIPSIALRPERAGGLPWSVPPGLPTEVEFLAVMFGLLALAWLAAAAMRLSRPHADLLPVAIVLALLGLGLTVLLRSRPDLFYRQTLACGIGLLAMGATALWPKPERLARYRFLAMAGAIVLLVLTVLFGREVNGARLALPLGPLEFQPSEVAKLLLAVFLAGMVWERQEMLARAGGRWQVTRADVRYLGPLTLALAVSLIAAQQDFGAALLVLGLFVAFLALATGRWILVLLAFVGLAFCGALALIALERVQQRVAIWLDPWADPRGDGYQIVQALCAFGCGGLRGVGIGRGFPDAIPALHTDMAIASLGEEMGFLGTAAVVVLALLLAVRGYRAAARAADDFLGLLAAGLTTALTLQTLVILGGTTALLPLTGVTLPFVSAGGTSVVANLALVGGLIAVSARPVGVSNRRDPTRSPWRRQLKRVQVAACLGLVAVGGQLYRWQVHEAERLVQHPANPRLTRLEPYVTRGPILDRYGRSLAVSLAAPGSRPRRALVGGVSFAPIVGYTSLQHGRAGIEAAANSWLTGFRQIRNLNDVYDRITRGTPGATVRLTLDRRLQERALELLGSRRGHVVMLDPRTGAILVLASQPTYPIPDVDANWERLQRDPHRPLVFRATQGVYPPGSTWKVVTAMAALEYGVVRVSDHFSCGGAAQVGDYVWHCFGGTAHGSLTFGEGLIRSCNITYGRVGLRLGNRRQEEFARRLGCNAAIPLEIGTSPSLFTPGRHPYASTPAQTGFGQGPVAVTPLQMALIAAAVARGGTLPIPYLIHQVRDAAGRVLAQTQPREWRRVMSPETAALVRELMVGVVECGTGRRCQIPGLRVAGKTGTAERPDRGPDHAWFIGFTPAEAPRVAMAVLVEGGGQGGRAAAPIAREMILAALGEPKALSPRESLPRVRPQPSVRTPRRRTGRRAPAPAIRTPEPRAPRDGERRRKKAAPAAPRRSRPSPPSAPPSRTPAGGTTSA